MKNTPTTARRNKGYLYYLIFINLFFAGYAFTQPYSGQFLLGAYLIESGVLGFIAILEIGRLARMKQEFIKPLFSFVLFSLPFFGAIVMSFWFIGSTMGYVSHDAEPGLFQNILGFIRHLFLPIIGITMLIAFVPYLIRRTKNSKDAATNYLTIILKPFWRLLFIFSLIIILGVLFQEDEGLKLEEPGTILSITLVFIFSIVRAAYDVLEYRHSKQLT